MTRDNLSRPGQSQVIHTSAARSLAPSRRRCDTPHANIELMTEKKVLDFQLAPRLEQVGDENAHHLEEIEHRI
jgi:hypothetical protein